MNALVRYHIRPDCIRSAGQATVTLGGSNGAMMAFCRWWEETGKRLFEAAEAERLRIEASN